jgi:hypothetical protein
MTHGLTYGELLDAAAGALATALAQPADAFTHSRADAIAAATGRRNIYHGLARLTAMIGDTPTDLPATESPALAARLLTSPASRTAFTGPAHELAVGTQLASASHPPRQEGYATSPLATALVEAGDLLQQAADLAASHFDDGQPVTRAGRLLRLPLLSPAALGDLARLTSAAVTLDQRLPGWWRVDEHAGGPYSDVITDHAADARWTASSLLGDTARQLITGGGAHSTSAIRAIGLAPRTDRHEWEIRTPGDCAALLHTAIGHLADRPGVMSLAELGAACRTGLAISTIAMQVSLHAASIQETPIGGQRHELSVTVWNTAVATLADLDIPTTGTATSALFNHITRWLNRTAAPGGTASIDNDQVTGWYQQLQTMAADLAPLAELALSSLPYLITQGDLPAPAAPGSITEALSGPGNAVPSVQNRLDTALTQAVTAASTMTPPPRGSAIDVQPNPRPLTHLDRLRPPQPTQNVNAAHPSPRPYAVEHTDGKKNDNLTADQPDLDRPKGQPCLPSAFDQVGCRVRSAIAGASHLVSHRVCHGFDGRLDDSGAADLMASTTLSRSRCG